MNTVLVVDDNSAIRMVISDFLALKFDRTRILEAADGAEGLALVETERPDLILLDAEMPNMNGLELAQQLRSEKDTQSIPIIAISSGADNNPVVSGLRGMSDASLPKPFTPDELIGVVNKVYGNRCVAA